jgi:predicted small secreted protein
MNTNKKILFLLAGAILLTSCATSRKEEIQAGGSKTSKTVQQVIDDLGLVYVEDGANSIITYDEVNAAQ